MRVSWIRQHCPGQRARSLVLGIAIAALAAGCGRQDGDPAPVPQPLRAGAEATRPALAPRLPRAARSFRGYASPTRLARTRDGKVLVVDSGAGLVTSLDPVTGARRDEAAGLGHPLGVALFEPDCVSGQGGVCAHPGRARTLLYVGDQADGSVKRFHRGKLIGQLGRGAGELAMPNAIAVTAAGLAYVVDSKARLVKVYDRAGAFLRSFGAGGSAPLRFPSDLAVDERAGAVYVADFEAGVIQVYDLAGSWQRTLAAPLNDQGDPIFWRPAGLGLDPDGNLLVVDNGLGCVVTMTPAGILVRAIGYADGRYWTGELELPVDAVSDGRHVVVSSNRTRSVVVFEVQP